MITMHIKIDGHYLDNWPIKYVMDSGLYDKIVNSEKKELVT